MKKKKYVTFQLFLVVVHIATLYLVVSEEDLALPINIVSFAAGSYAYESCIIACVTLLVANAVKYFYVFSGMSFIRSTLRSTQGFIRKVGGSILSSKIWKKRVRKNASIQNQAPQDSPIVNSPDSSITLGIPITPSTSANSDNSILVESMDPSIDMDTNAGPSTEDPILVEMGLSKEAIDILNLDQPKETSLKYSSNGEILPKEETPTKLEKIFNFSDESLYELNPSIEKQNIRNKKNQENFNAECMSKNRLCLKSSKPPEGSEDKLSNFLSSGGDIQEDRYIWMGWRHSDVRNNGIHTLSSLDGSAEVNGNSHIEEIRNSSLNVSSLGIATIYANGMI